MKNILLGASALATFCVMASATAAPTTDISEKLKSAQSKPAMGDAADQAPNAFGEYQLLPNVELRPSRQVQTTDRVGELGDMAAVRTDSFASSLSAPSQSGAQNKVTMGSVLRNRITGDIAKATGSLAVLLEDGDVNELASRYGLSVESSTPAVNLYVLRAREGQDLVALREALLKVDGVKAVKIDVLDNMQKPM